METNVKFSITGIKITHSFDDDNSRLDDYGKYTDTWEPGVLVRQRIGRNEYRYFKSAQEPWRDWKEAWNHVSEEDKASTIAKYGSLKAAIYEQAKQDMQRVEDYSNNRWWYISIKVEASILGIFPETPIYDEIASESAIHDIVYDTMYGIESDCPSDIEYWEEELTLNVRRDLSDMGFSMIELDEAFSKIQRVDL